MGEAVNIRVYRAIEAPKADDDAEDGEEPMSPTLTMASTVVTEDDDDDEEDYLDLVMPPSSTIYHLKCIIGDSWQLPPLCQTITMEVEADDPRVVQEVTEESRQLVRKRSSQRDVEKKVKKKPPVQLVMPNSVTVGSCVRGMTKEVRYTMRFAWHSAASCLVDPDAAVALTALQAFSRATGESDQEMCINAIADAGLLLNRNLTLRVTAVEVLQRITPAGSIKGVVSLLIPLLEDWEEPMRQAVEEALAHFVKQNNMAALNAIRKRLKFFKAGVRVATLRTMARVMPKGDAAAITDVCKLIEDPDAQVRAEAARTLLVIANQGEEKAIQQLAQRLGPKMSTEIRLIALHAFIRLTKKGDEKAVELLASFLLGDPIPDFRQHAAEGLAEVSPPADPATIKAWISSLGLMAMLPGAMERPVREKKKKKSAEEGEVAEQQEAPNLPGQVEGEEAEGGEAENGESESEEELPPIVAPERDDFWKVRLACVEGLSSVAKKRDHTVLQVLSVVLADEDGNVRRAALAAFVKVAGPKGDDFSMGLMIQQLHHRVGDVRYLAVSALRHLGGHGDEQTTLALVQAMKDPSMEVRKAAIETLPEIAAKDREKVILAIVSLLQDSFADIRLAALMALPLVSSTIGKSHAVEVRKRLEDIDRRVQVEAHKVLSLV